MKPRRLVLMPDYHCNPLWEYEDEDLSSNPAPEELPFSESTILGLRAWAAWFDSFINMADPHDSRDVSHEESAEFHFVGRELWSVIRHELGAAWVVSYCENGELFLPPDQDFEF
jgi:hypothetical protein